MPLIFGLILKLCLSRRCTRRCSLSFRSMGRSVFWDVSENRVSPPMQNCWFELSQKMLLIVLIIIILCLANLYTSCLLNRKIYAEMFNSSKRPVVFFDLSTENCVSNLLSHEMRVPRSSLIFSHIYGKFLSLTSIAWMTTLTLSMLRDLVLPSRTISFIMNVLLLGFLLSLPIPHTFENIICHLDLRQSLSSETSQ